MASDPKQKSDPVGDLQGEKESHYESTYVPTVASQRPLCCRHVIMLAGSAFACAVATLLILSTGSITKSSSPSTLSAVHADKPTIPRTHNDDKKKRLPQCLIIGARKCGTRALLEFMNLHPQVAIAPEEVHFFDNDLHYSRGYEWYQNQMPVSSSDQITVEKSPRYFIDELTPARVREMNSSIKLILILRDPVTRTVSDFAQILANRQKRGKRVKRFGRLIIDPETKEINTNLRMVTTSMYTRHLANWYRSFDRHQLHIVNGDNLVHDPFTELKKVEKFLGLKSFLRRDQFVFNATKGFYCARKDTGMLCLNNGKGRPHPIVSKRILRKLRRFFRRSNKQLFEMTGQHFTWE